MTLCSAHLEVLAYSTEQIPGQPGYTKKPCLRRKKRKPTTNKTHKFNDFVNFFQVDFPSPACDIVYTSPQVDRNVIQQYKLETLENDVKGKLLDILHRDSSFGYGLFIIFLGIFCGIKHQVQGLILQPMI